MTFEEWKIQHEKDGPCKALVCCHNAWDAATLSERDRCAQVVWMCRGHCMNDDAALDLMEKVRRER
jgi:hypothetical protein